MEQTPKNRLIPIPAQERKSIPEGIWLKCPACKEITFVRELERNFKVCPHCRYHYPLSRAERVSLLLEPGSFKPFGQGNGCLCGTGAFGERQTAVAVVGSEERRVSAPILYAELAPFVEMAAENGLPLTLFYALDARLDPSDGRLLSGRVSFSVASGSGHRASAAPGIAGIRLHHALKDLAERRLPYLLILTDGDTAQNSRPPLPFGDITITEGNRVPRPAPNPYANEIPSEDARVDFTAPRTELPGACESFLLFFAANGKEYGKRPAR